MPRYGHAGPGQLRRLDADSKDMEVSKPASPDVSGSDEILYKCTVEECDRKFRKRMILARHFNATHSDLMEDEDSWREFCEEVSD